MKPASFCFVVVGTVLVCAGLPARADEGGVPFWFSGQYASFVAVPQDPGFYIPVIGYYYNGGAEASHSFQHGGTISAGINSQAGLLMIAPTFVPDVKILGGQLSLSLAIGGGAERTTAQVSTTRLGTVLNRVDEIWGITDLYPTASLSWGLGLNNLMVYVTGNNPVGAYDSERLSNLGLGHPSVDAGGGYTLLSTNTGTEFSFTAGFTYNLENPSTDYKNGVDFHLDYAVSQFLSQHFHIGPVGYLYYQITGDSGTGDRLGSFESRVAAIGGEMGYFFKVAGRQWYANVRGYDEFWSENRVRGYDIWVVLNIPLGGVKHKSS